MKINGLHKKFDETVLYDDFSLTLPAGKTSCLLGPSGCGKTSLLNMVAGLLEPEGGTILPESWEGNLRFSYAFQEARLLPWMTVLGNLIYGQDGGLNRHERKERARKMLRSLELEGAEHKLPRELSGGMARRVGLGRALLADYDLLLMDEPLASLDREMKERMIGLIREELRGKSALLVTHDYYTARLLSDHIFVLTAPPVRAREIGMAELETILEEINRAE
ncbi:MAG: ATP-binding cassette domain-containing protein [Spirochaetales bacterium]|nr:ATP-binding cassette domain-containing protein [Spirochaetales bacterium]